MTKFNALSDKPERQESDSESQEMKKRLKDEPGDSQQWNNGFIDGGELDDWLTSEDEIDHFLHYRQ